LRIFDNKVLSTVYEPKREESTGCSRKCHNEELHNLYSSPNIIREEDEMEESCRIHGKDEKCIRNFGQKRPLGGRLDRQEDKIRMDLKETGCEAKD
jgi:hypothetical protein